MRSLVFTSASVGYVFYIDGNGQFVYSKTTDGGVSWGAANVVGSATTYLAFDVWFDQWTPGDSGTLIHCVYFDTAVDDVFYRTVDTGNSDTLGTQRVVFAGGSAAAGVGVFCSVTKTLDGKIYVAYDIDAGAERGFHRSTDGGVSFSANLSTTFVEATLDYALLLPASGTGDGADCAAIYFDSSAQAITVKVWNSSSASAVESATLATVVVASGIGTDGTGQYCFSASIRHSDGHIILSVVTERDTATSDHVVRDVTLGNSGGTPTISGANLTDITTNSDDHYYPSMFIDQLTGDIYVAYHGKRDGSEALGTSASIYYTKSTDGGATWSAGDTAYREGPTGGHFQTWAPLMGPRFGVVWRGGTSVLNFNAPNSLTFSAGPSDIVATLTQTLGALTSTGEADIAIAGSVAQTLGALTSSGEADIAIAGSVAQTLGTLTSAGEGDVNIAASLAQTLGVLTLTSEATTSNSITASLEQTLGALTLSSEADVEIAGSSSNTLGALTATGQAAVHIAATANVALGIATLLSEADVSISANVNNTLGALSSSSEGDLALVAVVSQVLGALTLESSVNSGQPRTATLDQTLGALTLDSDMELEGGEQQPSISSGGAPRRSRRSKKPSFIGVREGPQPIVAKLNLELGELRILSRAAMGEHPKLIARRRAIAALLMDHI